MAIIVDVTPLNTSESNIYVSASYESGGTQVRKVQWFYNGYYSGQEAFTSTTSTTKYHTFSGLYSGTSYKIEAKFFDSNENEVGSAYEYISTKSEETPAPTGFSVSASGSTELYMSWNSVSGATSYEVSMYNPYSEQRTTSSSYMYWGGLSPNTFYYFQVRAYDSSKSGWSDWSTYDYAKTDEATQTSTPSGLNGTANSSTELYIDWGGVSGADSYEIRIVSPISESRTVYNSYIYWGGLSPNTQYKFQVRAYDSAKDIAWSIWSGYQYATTLLGRPSNFVWDSNKYSGYDFKITASEWNKLCNRVNEFRDYKGLSSYGFTTAYSGNDFTANQYNQVRNAINSMSPPTNIPVSRSKGDTIYASDINKLRDSLNSIT
jgi:hypothetical protein